MSQQKPWYDDKSTLERMLESGDLATLNAIADSRMQAGYKRGERLSEYIVLGHYWMDTVGNTGHVLWSKERLWSDNFEYPTIATVAEWKEFLEFLKNSGFVLRMDEGLGFSIDSGLPEADSICDQCGRKWTIKDCSMAVVRRETKIIDLSKYVGQTLVEVCNQLRSELKTTVFFQPDAPVFNKGYAGLEFHPVYRNFSIRNQTKSEKGWLNTIDQNEYRVQPGDEGYVNIWHYRHPNCQRRFLVKAERKSFDNIFSRAGFEHFDMVELPNEYCSDPTCCGPWFFVITERGNFKIGWRKRVIELHWEGEGIGPKRNIDWLFNGEDVTRGGGMIHAWGDEKAIEYLQKIREADPVSV